MFHDEHLPPLISNDVSLNLVLVCGLTLCRIHFLDIIRTLRKM